VWPPYQGSGTGDHADLVKLGFTQLNLMLLHSTLVWQMLITEHKIGRHEVARGNDNVQWQAIR